MLSAFCSLIVTVVVAYAAYYVLDFIFEIGYHKEPGLGSGEILHVHFYSAPGVENRQKAVRITKAIYEKYKKYLKGVSEPKW